MSLSLELIQKNGGLVEENLVKIKKQDVKVAPLEQNFEGYKLTSRSTVGKKITSSDPQEFETDFDGVGVVLTGRVANMKFKDKYALISDEETMNGYKLNVEFYLDGELTKTMTLPLYFIERAHELYFQYEIPEEPHKLSLKVVNPHKDVYLQIDDLIVYGRK